MSVFKFKKFNILHSKSAQKVGTDAVLLGSWAQPLHKPYSILDIGAGTGVISLMMAQRFETAYVEGIEIEENAFEEATHNFENSDYNDRMFCYHASLQEFVEEDESEEKYDLMVSNPPFFDQSSNKFKEQNSRNTARFDDALPFEDLIYGVYKLLANEGVFACIIPYDREQEFLKIAALFTLAPLRICRVKGTQTAHVKRSLIEIGFDDFLKARFRESENNINLPEITELVLEKERHQYTDQAKELFQDFYLNL